MYSIKYTGSFKKDFKRIAKRNYNPELLKSTINILVNNGKLPAYYKPHKLSGDYAMLWECHIKSGWLLIWDVDDNSKTITLYRTGTHSDLF